MCQVPKIKHRWTGTPENDEKLALNLDDVQTLYTLIFYWFVVFPSILSCWFWRAPLMDWGESCELQSFDFAEAPSPVFG